MKKSLIGMVVMAFLFLGGYAYGGCLTVNSPNGGEVWPPGSSHNILWSSSCPPGTKVKIILRKGGARLGRIVAGIPASQGSYNWTVGQYQGGTAPLGNDYRILIKTMDGSVMDASNSDFSILYNLPPGAAGLHIPKPNPAAALSRPDLKIKTNDTKLKSQQSHTVRVRFHTAIENAGNVGATNIKARLRITGPSESPLNNHSETIIYPSLSSGHTTGFTRTFDIHTPGTYHFTFTVDPDNSISELNESNNTITRNITVNAPDLIVWLFNPRVYMYGPGLYIGVLNIGNATSPPTKLKVYVKGKGTKEYTVPRLGPCENWNFHHKVTFYTNRDSWVELTIDPYNQIREVRKDNNFTRTKLDVRAGSYDDVWVEPPALKRCNQQKGR